MKNALERVDAGSPKVADRAKVAGEFIDIIERKFREFPQGEGLNLAQSAVWRRRRPQAVQRDRVPRHVDALGGPVAYVTAWLEQAAKCKERQTTAKQQTLF